MKVIDLYPRLYVLYIKNAKSEEKLFTQKELPPSSSNRHRINLFENPEVFFSWLEEEQEILASKGLWSSHKIYSHLYIKEMQVGEFIKLMKEREEIDSLVYLDKNRIRKLYFRDDLELDYLNFPSSSTSIEATEVIYIINRQRKLEDGSILQKEASFVTYPELATPLFSQEVWVWSQEMLSRQADQGYYVEETNLRHKYTGGPAKTMI